MVHGLVYTVGSITDSAVDDQVRSRPRESFRDSQIVVCDSVVLIREFALVVEPQVGSLDDQSIPFCIQSRTREIPLKQAPLWFPSRFR